MGSPSTGSVQFLDAAQITDGGAPINIPDGVNTVSFEPTSGAAGGGNTALPISANKPKAAPKSANSLNPAHTCTITDGAGGTQVLTFDPTVSGDFQIRYQGRTGAQIVSDIVTALNRGDSGADVTAEVDPGNSSWARFRDNTGLGDGTWAGSALFTFDNTNTVSLSEDELASDLADLVNASILNVTATADADTVSITNDSEGAAGNVAITTTQPGSAVSITGMGGGFMAEANPQLRQIGVDEDYDLGGYKLLNPGAATADTQYPTFAQAKSYADDLDTAVRSYVDAQVDAAKNDFDLKDPCRVASTANLDISSAVINGATIDGIAVATGDRVLLKDQTDSSENGIYVVVASGAASRSSDANADSEVTTGLFTAILEGSANGGGQFVLTTQGTITLDTTDLAFTRYNGGGSQLTASLGVQKVGSDFRADLDSDGGLELNGNSQRVKMPANAGLVRDSNGIAVNPGSAGGLELDGSNGLQVKAANPTISLSASGTAVGFDSEGSAGVGTGGVIAAVPSTASGDQEFSPGAEVSGSNADTGLTFAANPVGRVHVRWNGLIYSVGLADTAKFYVRDSGDSTTRAAFSDMVSGDKIFSNGITIKTTDTLSLVYNGKV